MNKTYNFPPIICITTTKSKDRLNNFIHQCNLYNITNYNIYSFKPYNECNYTIGGEFIDKIQENSKGPVTSHIKALSTWYHSNDDEYALVLEDDTNLKTIEYWPFSWSEFFNMLPEDWECVQLCSIRDSYENIDICFRRRINSDWGCQAYLIKRSYIKKILDKYYINSNTFNLNISNIEVYFDIDNSPELYNLFPTVENTLFEGTGKVYNFPLFTEDIENTVSTFYENTGLHQDHNHVTSYKYIIDWWENKGQHTNIYQIFNHDYCKTIDIFLVKSDFGLEEYDYLISLLPENSKINLRTYSDEELLNINQTCDIIIYRIFGMYPEKFSRVLNNIKPKIMINLSDEFYHENNEEFNQLGSYAKLYLRNYHHKNYTYTSNTLHIPLGYCSGVVLSKDELIKGINEKTYAWSWVGNFKSDRYEMIEQFKNINPYFFSDNISRSTIAELYNDSIFVPCGRGNYSLDCWRLYEASSCGAIPVVVGSIEEIKETFKYEENPPWIFSENWQQARITCQNLLHNKDLLQKIQDNLLLWWNNRINKIKKQIHMALK